MVEHTHYQFNSVVIGLTLWAFYFMEKEQFRYATAMFTLAFNFKQHSIFLAMPSFLHMVSLIVKDKSSVLKVLFGCCLIPSFHSSKTQRKCANL